MTFQTATAQSGALIKWHVFYWKLWDAESLVTDQRPAEAVRLANSGIDITVLDSLAHPTSCLPMLRQTQTLFTSERGMYQGYKLNEQTAAVIEEIEQRLFAGIKLAAMKRIKPNAKPRPSGTTNHPQVSAQLRDTILRRDKYRCIFCGGTSSSTALEVNHIIPRSLIRKLHLNSVLHTAPRKPMRDLLQLQQGEERQSGD